jgi:catecholate siderophore receptor
MPVALPLGALMLAASVNAWAQSSAPTKTLSTVVVEEKAEEPQGKDTVRTRKTSIGKGTQDIRDIPQSINVLTERLIDDVKLDTLKEALHYTSGISFAATENGTDQDIRMRGFPVATTGDLLIDGMRDPSQYDRDTFNYDRVEIMRGSASMIFGRGSTGGVINQVNKQPMLLDQYELEGTIGSRGFFRTTADLNKQMGDDAALRLNLMYNKSDNGGATIDKYGIAPTYRWGIGTRDEFSVGLFHLNVDNTPVSAIRYLNGTVPTAIDPSNFYGKASDYLLGKATYATASWKRRLDDGGELKTQLRSGVFDRDQWSTVAGFGTTNGATTTLNNLSAATILTRTGLAPRKDQYTGTYLQSDYSNIFNWGGVKHEVLAGADFAHEEAERYGGYGNGVATTWTNFNKGNTTVGTPNDGTYTATSPLYRKTSYYSGNTMGVYAQDLVQVAEHWKLLAGLRWDTFRASMGQYTYANINTTTPATNPTSSLSYPSLWSYRLGALYQPTPTSSYHLSYSTSFNTSVDTYQYTSQQTANTPAEKSRNIELGAKLDWLDGKLSTRGAIFRSEKYNERTTDSDFAGTAYTLSGKRHSTGLELDVVGRINPQWEIYASFTWIPEAKIDKTGSSGVGLGQRVGLTPEYSASTWLSYQATPKLRVAGGVRAVSENRPLQGTTGAASTTAKAPGYVVADAMVEYKIEEDLTAQFNVTNIANRTYGDQLYPGFVVLGQPRTLKATLTKRF